MCWRQACSLTHHPRAVAYRTVDKHLAIGLVFLFLFFAFSPALLAACTYLFHAIALIDWVRQRIPTSANYRLFALHRISSRFVLRPRCLYPRQSATHGQVRKRRPRVRISYKRAHTLTRQLGPVVPDSRFTERPSFLPSFLPGHPYWRRL